MYWYAENKAWKGSELWGEMIQVPGTPLVVKTFGNKVTKKQCRYCDVMVWTNNPESICGKLSCWMNKTNQRSKNHAFRVIR